MKTFREYLAEAKMGKEINEASAGIKNLSDNEIKTIKNNVNRESGEYLIGTVGNIIKDKIIIEATADDLVFISKQGIELLTMDTNKRSNIYFDISKLNRALKKLK